MTMQRHIVHTLPHPLPHPGTWKWKPRQTRTWGWTPLCHEVRDAGFEPTPVRMERWLSYYWALWTGVVYSYLDSNTLLLSLHVHIQTIWTSLVFLYDLETTFYCKAFSISWDKNSPAHHSFVDHEKTDFLWTLLLIPKARNVEVNQLQIALNY